MRRDPRYQYDFGDFQEEYFRERELRCEYFEPDFFQEEQFVPREEQYRPEVEPQFDQERVEDFYGYRSEEEGGLENEQRESNRPWRPPGREEAMDEQPLQREAHPPQQPSPRQQPEQPLPPSPSQSSPCPVSTEICDELTAWLTKGMSGEESKAISKRFPLKFAEESFEIRPHMLDSFMQRQAKDKEVLRNVNCAEEVLVALQHKIGDVAPPLIDLYALVSALEEGEIAVEAAKDSVRSALRQ